MKTAMLQKAVDLAARALVWVGGLLILCVMLITIGDILTRWTLQTGFIGLVDITQFAVVGFAYLSLPYLFRTEGNVAIALYDKHVSPRQDAALRLLANLLSLGILGLLLRYGWERAERVLRFGDVSQNIEIPMIAFWALILSSLALSLAIVVLQIFGSLSQLKAKNAD